MGFALSGARHLSDPLMLDVLAPYSPALVALILLLLLIAFATEIRPPEVTAIGAAGLLLVLGLISTDDIY